MSRRPARWILEDALSSTTRALEALNDGETVVAVQILAGLACGDRDRDRRGAGQPVRELRAPFRLARSVGASHAVRALGRALDAVGAGGVMSGPPDETYFVDSDDIEFGEGYDMSKLPPPLPTAEQVAEAWTAGEHDDLDPRPAGDPELADGPVFVDLREREMRNVHWHDRPFLPAGELVTNNADGDTGKGLVAVHYAARFSHGEFGERRMVVFAVAEDDFETVLKPRLVAAEANLAYIRCIGWRRKGTDDALRIPDDVPVLEQHLQTMGVGLFVIDPLLSHLSAKTNTHVDHEVKLALRPVMQLAHNLGCAALGNGHFGKEKGAGARRATMGSTAFTNTPRCGWAMAYDDEDPDVRVVEVIKSNIGPKGVGRNYRLKTVAVDGLAEQLPLLVPESAATKSVDELIRAARWTKRIPGELVRELVLAELETGEKSRQYLDTIAEEKLGASHDTVYQSGLTPLRKDGLIVARKESKDGPWLWCLKPADMESL